MAYEIKINAFQGPFDLLFYLIEKNELDIYNIPIAEITEQYLEYLDQMETMDLDITSEFLVMAARLLAIKAKMLLPKPIRDFDNQCDEELDPRQELVNQLLEYKMFKEIAHYLKEKEQSSGKIFSRAIDPEELMEQFAIGKNQLKNLTLSSLAKAFDQVIARLEQEERVVKIEIDEYSIETKMAEITKKLFLQPNGVQFFQLFGEGATIKEVVITFLALLELTKLQQIIVVQINPLGDIFIFRNTVDGRD
ncbi:MAG: segregation/condensation protein A [Clostridia bacterium]|nr:segregation/condensation protein A [Clostridia bacterium]